MEYWLYAVPILIVGLVLRAKFWDVDADDLEKAARKSEPLEVAGQRCAHLPIGRVTYVVGIALIGCLIALAWVTVAEPPTKPGGVFPILLGIVVLCFLIWSFVRRSTERFLWDQTHLIHCGLLRKSRRWEWADLKACSRRHMKNAFELDFGEKGKVLVSTHHHGHVRLIQNAGRHLASAPGPRARPAAAER